MSYYYDLTDTHVKIYYESDTEFEQVRSQCLEENNWLRENYTRDNLKIEKHSGYGVLYQTSTGKPMVMGGVFNDDRYPSNVAKQINRLYTFPDFRMTPATMLDGFKCTCRLISELEKINSFDVYIITMQNRFKRPNNGFWKTWCNYMQKASDNAWTIGENYVQTCPYNVKKCWQNFVYKEFAKNAYADWNPKTITHETWLSLEEGK